MEKGRPFVCFFGPPGDFHGRMAVCGNAALRRAGDLFIGPLSLALRARLVCTRPLLIEIVRNIFGTHLVVVQEQLKFRRTGFELFRALRTSLLYITCLYMTL